jgi:FSR family fosmidomycin resistance protein-like MFS transporter
MSRVRDLLGLNRRYLVLWGTSLGHGYTHLFPSIFYLLLPLIKKEFGLTYTQMGLLISMRFICQTLVSFPSGMLVDLLGQHRLVMILSMASVWASSLVAATTSQYGLLLACMGFLGIGNNLWHPAAMSVLHHAYPQTRGLAMGWQASAANIGDALGPLLCGIALAWLSWRQILVIGSVPGLLLFFLTVWLLGKVMKEDKAGLPSPGEGAKQTGERRISFTQYAREVARLFTNRGILALSLVNGIRALTQNGLSTFLPSFLMTLLHLSPWVSGIYMTVLQVSGIIASPVAGHASDRYGRRKVVRASLLSMSVGILLLVLLNLPWLFIVFLGIVGFSLYAVRPVLLAWSMELAPHKFEGTVISMQFSFQAALSAVAPVVGGWIADRWGLIYTFYFLAAMVLLSNGLVLFVKGSEDSRESHQAVV